MGGLWGRVEEREDTRDCGGGGENSFADGGTGLNSREPDLGGGEANDLLVDVEGGGEPRPIDDMLVDTEVDKELDKDGREGKGWRVARGVTTSATLGRTSIPSASTDPNEITEARTAFVLDVSPLSTLIAVAYELALFADMARERAVTVSEL